MIHCCITMLYFPIRKLSYLRMLHCCLIMIKSPISMLQCLIKMHHYFIKIAHSPITMLHCCSPMVHCPSQCSTPSLQWSTVLEYALLSHYSVPFLLYRFITMFHCSIPIVSSFITIPPDQPVSPNFMKERG